MNNINNINNIKNINKMKIINNQNNMGATWKKMYTVLKKSSQSNASVLENRRFCCDNFESAEEFVRGTSFSAILADNILQK